MPAYDFRNLSSLDFEHFVRDVLNADEPHLRLRSFPAGRDRGIDLRHVVDNHTTIVQCKHYAVSGPNAVIRVCRDEEAAKAEKLAANRYLLVTSAKLTLTHKDTLLSIFTDKGVHLAIDDIWGNDDLNAALGRHPKVEEQHFKLWLASSVVLKSIMNHATWQRSSTLLDRLPAALLPWVDVPEYDAVTEALDASGTCTIAGPPGSGKSYLAEVILANAVHNGWQPTVVMNNIEEALPIFDKDIRQIFYYDDFLGQSAFQLTAKNEPDDLIQFMKRVSSHRATKRLILTTRDQVLSQGATDHDRVRQLTDATRYPIVRLNRYRGPVREHLLLNHINASKMPPSEKKLVGPARLRDVVDHPSYNPRILSSVIEQLDPATTADEAIARLEQALECPEKIWEVSFGKLTKLDRDILLTVATLPAGRWPATEIRALVPSEPHPLDWRQSLKVLEPGWIRTSGLGAASQVALANPSCREFLHGVLDDFDTATEQITRLERLDQIVALTRAAGLQVLDQHRANATTRPDLAAALLEHRDQLADLIRRIGEPLMGATAGSTRARGATLDCTQHLVLYGSPASTEWLLTYLEPEHFRHENAANLFALADRVAALPTDEPRARDKLAAKIASTAAERLSDLHDLDAYEALPDSLAHLFPVEAIRADAIRIIASELADLMDSVNNGDVLEATARDLRERAAWYGSDLAIDDALDQADALRASNDEESHL